ncbi:MAG: membrane integrity-associated transporter subunit PqiC [Candidatus Tectomicrobia bacterium]|uniref:Membrane integrity-associated transporter subunit PqiC n=1 Tax=Tectimicrobiota bacterium TaxID=2528274 RepID=A0A938B596_UNCTE|nr:membrane integrity-associated transporter subunit PqiC [Candidatus Tectomicrobia bacterium]
MSALHRWSGACCLGLLTLVLSLSSCSTGSTPRLYVLTPLTPGATSTLATATQGLTIGVGPVELPQYVNRPQMVTGHHASELHSAALAQWAEPLQSGFIRVLAENLSLLLGTERIALFPWKSFIPEYQVVIEVTHFLEEPGGGGIVGGALEYSRQTRARRVGE